MIVPSLPAVGQRNFLKNAEAEAYFTSAKQYYSSCLPSFFFTYVNNTITLLNYYRGVNPLTSFYVSE